MNRDQALSLLGCKLGDPPEKVSQAYRRLARIYHPNNQRTGDPVKFMLISDARRIALGENTKSDELKAFSDEIAFDLQIDNAIDDFFEGARADYVRLREKDIAPRLERIRSGILACKSKSEIREIFDKTLQVEMSSIRVSIKRFIKTTEAKASSIGAELTYYMFRDLYSDYRTTWIAGLWRNPIGWAGSSTLVAGVVTYLTGSSFLSNRVFNLSDYIILLFLSGTCFFWLIFQLYLLSPARQFAPPRLSITAGEHAMHGAELQMSLTSGELAGGGAVVGAAIGVPGGPLGMAIGAGLGALIGSMFGPDFEKVKQEMAGKLSDRLTSALCDLDAEIDTWLTQRSNVAKRRVRETFQRNVARSRRVIEMKPQLLLGYMPDYKP